MFWMAIGIAGFFLLAVVGSMFDSIGWGYLLSSHVDEVADARMSEPALGMPWLYFLAAFVAAVGMAATSEYGPLVRFGLGLGIATFLLVTVWDMRRRRGSLAVYIRLRRAEIGFQPVGDVIEVPKLMFVVMNEPGPVVWLMLAGSALVIAAGLWSYSAYFSAVPLLALAILAVGLWRLRKRGPWEPVAVRLRRASFLQGPVLEQYLEEALGLDPEVVLLRIEAESMVARLMSGSHE